MGKCENCGEESGVHLYCDYCYATIYDDPSAYEDCDEVLSVPDEAREARNERATK